MRRTLALFALGAIAYALFLVATLPAQVVAAAAESRSGGRLQLTHVRGTAWKGEARASVMPMPGGRLDLEHVAWRLDAGALAAARLAFNVLIESPGIAGKAEVGRGFREWSLRELDARVDAGVLGQAVPLLAAWRPQGPVRVSVQHLAFDGEALRGEAALEWREAALALSTVRPLGTWRLEATASGGPGTLTLTSTAGPLRLAGKGTFAPNGSFSLEGSARGEGPDAANLDPLLDLMGPRRPDGTRALALRWP